MKLGFYGSAGTVTGSRFLLEQGRSRILIDCGMFQGLKPLRQLNWNQPPFDPHSIDAIVLTHAHIDHSGNLPRLVREGFRGPIYCTAATKELAEILLRDAAHLQEEDAAYANRKKFSKHNPALPLFTAEDAERTIRQLHVQTNGDAFTARDFEVRFHGSGHILGATFVEVRAKDDGGTSETLVFSGDLGRYDAPIHPDPDALVDCDTLVIESTYGDRIHPESTLEDQLHGAFHRTLGQGGIVLIPAFAVARAQLILSLLRKLMDEGRLPVVPVHLDSPMAIDVTQLYAEYAGPEGLEIEKRDLFGKWVRYHRTVDESRALNMMRGPRIIVSSSGMMTGGRVLHHLKRLLPNRQNLIVLVGYQSAGTRGRSLLEGAKFLRIHGHDVPVRAPYLQVQGLSAHADAAELQRWALSGPSKPAATFFVHGEPEGLEALQRRFRDADMPGVIPALNQVFERKSRGKWLRVK